MDKPPGSVIYALRAATLKRGSRSERITVVELDAKEDAPVLHYFVSTIPAVVRSSFSVTPASPLILFEQEVARHPVFQVMPPQQMSV